MKNIWPIQTTACPYRIGTTSRLFDISRGVPAWQQGHARHIEPTQRKPPYILCGKWMRRPLRGQDLYGKLKSSKIMCTMAGDNMKGGKLLQRCTGEL